jgi:hypothetical protein
MKHIVHFRGEKHPNEHAGTLASKSKQGEK